MSAAMTPWASRSVSKLPRSRGDVSHADRLNSALRALPQHRLKLRDSLLVLAAIGRALHDQEAFHASETGHAAAITELVGVGNEGLVGQTAASLRTSRRPNRVIISCGPGMDRRRRRSGVMRLRSGRL